MENNITRLKNFYTEEISKHISKPAAYNLSHQLKQMAAFFSPGLFYYYVLNFHDLKMEFVSDGTQEILGIAPEEFSTDKILQMISPEEMELMQKKEALVLDFMFNFLSPEEMPFYKVVYFLQIKDVEGQHKNILHQVTTLSVSETGKMEHVLGIHTDISHLGAINNDKVSFISLNGNRSYFNLDPENAFFDPQNCNPGEAKISVLLTKRELEIIKLLSEGLTANRIAGKLNISENTVRTHRKNMLLKTECSNITELVARCLVEGVI